MSGSAGQAMPTEFAQSSGNKGTGQPMQTAMGTPIVYGKSYLNNNQMVTNQSTASPLSAVQAVMDNSGSDGM